MPKLCARCPATFEARSNRQKYCVECGREVTRERNRESTRRRRATPEGKTKHREANRESGRRYRATPNGRAKGRERDRRRRGTLEYREAMRKALRRYYATANGRAKTLMKVHRRRARLRDGCSPGVNPEFWETLIALLPRCSYCGAAAKLTRDHLRPIAKGGRDENTNVLPACGACNASKRDAALRVWLRRRGRGNPDVTLASVVVLALLCERAA